MNSGLAQNAWTEGPKTLLFIRVAFPDDPTEPISQDDANQLMGRVNSWYVENSYGKTAITTDVTPLLMLPRTKTWYSQQPSIQLLTDARAAALQNGFDTSNYDRDMVRFNNVPGWNFSGTSNIGAKGSWLQSSSLGVVVHELGHQYGLEHANSWNAPDDSMIGPGSNSEYGNVFDTMASPQPDPGMYEFNVAWKNRLNWLEDKFVQTVATSGTYRLRAFDVPNLESGGLYALRIRKDAFRDYWAEFRQKFNNNTGTQNGILLNWSPWPGSNRGTQLLDTTPATPFGNNDAALLVGRTFSDLEAGLHITPIAVGSSGTNRWIDVQVNLGAFPTNEAPTVTLAADATNALPGVVLNFQATATDPNGDVLAYYWDFGDGGFSTHGTIASHSWNQVGEYVVRCRVTDLKGGNASRSLIVAIGSPASYRIRGKITEAGSPLENVRIYISSAQMTYTDSDGTYTLVGLSSGSYQVNSSLYGHTFSKSGFSNPVRVGPDAGNIDFIAFPNPPSITGQPQRMTVPAGSDATFTVMASGVPPLRYQWRFNGHDITGATASSYTRSNVQIGDEGNYEVVVTNAIRSVTSNAAALTVIAPPIITWQPQSQAVNAGSDVTFSVSASGRLPMDYYWIFNATNVLAGATNSALTITNVQAIDAGFYSVLVVNNDGGLMSSNALLTVNRLPVAGTDTIERLPTQGVKVSVATLLANDTDPDGDTLSVVAVDSPSPNGGLVTLQGEWVSYTPLAGFTNEDSFTYAVSDKRGGTATGMVTVNITDSQSQNVARIQDLGNGSFRMTFNGIPGKTYTIQYTPDLDNPDWQTLATVTADSLGVFVFNDTSGSSSRFYRSAYP